jgi:long-chain acyl-CoA synthetase
MNLSTTLSAVARHLPNAPAITAPEGTLSYSALEDHVTRIAGALLGRHGLPATARVAILMDNCLSFLPAMFGIWRAGLAAVPINSKLHPKEVAWILENSATKLVLAGAKHADALTALSVRLPQLIVDGSADWRCLIAAEPLPALPADPNADAWLFYTSGTTGRPKGAVLTHRNLLFACHAYYADIDFVDDRDVCAHAAPLSHGSGLYALPHILRGAHQIVLPGFEPADVLALFAKHQNVSMFAAPTMVSRLINHPLAGSSDTRGLKTLIYGGAPMYVSDLKRAISLFGPKFFQLYGQGEAPMTISGLTKRMHADFEHPNYEARLGSAGIARTGCAFRVVDEDGRDMPTGEVGEIISKSDCVMRGYLNNPEANAKSLRDGWLWTGDLGSVDADGFLTLKDRSKDMIISGGSNIYPREIEEVLLTHPAVLECAVVSRPHADWGEEVIAYVVSKPGVPVPGAQALDTLCLANIARFKRPKAYRFVASLPKNNYGKILKTDLRVLLAAEVGGGS